MCVCAGASVSGSLITDCKGTNRKEAGQNTEANGPIVRNLTRFNFSDFGW